MARDAYVIKVLFNTRDRMFLGRGGQWQSPEDFLKNPPENLKDVVPEEHRDKPKHKGKGNGAGGYKCLDDVYYYVSVDPFTGVESYYYVMGPPCPPEE